MATVTGLTADRMQEIIDATIIDANVVGDDLVLTLYDSTTVNVGNVRGPMGPGGTLFDVVTSSTRPTLTAPDEGYVIYETDTNLTRIWTGSRWKLQERIIGASTSRPAMVSADQGVVLYETDTGLEYIWTGTTWLLTSAHMPLFANAAARDAAIGSGDRKLGMTVWQTAEGGLFTWNGTAWKGQPNGDLGYVKKTTNSAIFPFSSGTPSSGSIATYRISGLSITLNVPANRILEVKFNSLTTMAAAAYVATVALYRDTTELVQQNIDTYATQACPMARATGVAGSQTFYVCGWVGAVQPTTIQAAAANPAYFTVTDVGST